MAASYYLTIDTATPQAIVSLVGKQTVRQAIASTNRADNLLIQIKAVLEEEQCQLDQLNAIIVRRGLGSYTGLRIGLAVGSSLAWALQKPLQTIESPLFEPIDPRVMVEKSHQDQLNSSGWPTVVPIYGTWQSSIKTGRI